MSAIAVFARLLLVMLFLFSAFNKFQETAKFEGMLLSGYKNLHSYIQTSTGFVIPIAPAMIGLYAKNLILLTGILQTFASLLVIFNYRIGVYILCLLLVSFNVVIHNPLFYKAGAERDSNIQQFLLNLGWLGALLLVCGDKKKVKRKIKSN